LSAINIHMPRISRNRVDRARTGHPCTSSIGCIASQNSVFGNGIALLRRGDALIPHTILVPCGKTVCCKMHGANIKRGSPNVFVQGVPVARVGDSADLGSMRQGSPNVFANGG
jgi:uncharacterized Zn-binding protein involved in type VI secretion